MGLNEKVRKIKKGISQVLSEEEKTELLKWTEESDWVRNSTLSKKKKLSKLIEIAAEHEALKNVFNLFWRNVKKSLWTDREFATRSAVIGMAVGISFGLFLGVGIAAVAIGGLSGAGAAMVASVTMPSFLLTAGGGALIGALIGELIRSEEKRQLESEAVFKDATFDEVVKEYYESGKLKAEGIHKNGEADGASKEYYESGQLKAEGNYKNGEPNGIFREYYETGQLKAEGVYMDGEPDGMFREYYESGQLKSESVCKHGMPVGKGKMYDEEGNLKP